MEPGEAVGWQTGYLVATVLDIVNNGMDLAILILVQKLICLIL